MTPLHMAVEGARIKVVEYLVGEEADVNFQDYTGVKCTTCDTSDYTSDLSLSYPHSQASAVFIVPLFCCLKDQFVSIRNPKLLVVP